VDDIYQAMMTHKRTMVNLKSMGPKLLVPSSGSNINGVAAAAAAAGAPAGNSDADVPLAMQMKRLQQQLAALQAELEHTHEAATRHKEAAKEQTRQAYAYGKWPVEATAARRGVRLSSTANSEEKKDAANPQQHEMQAELQQALDRQMAYVDRVEQMPSPYLWEVLRDATDRADELQERTAALQRQQLEQHQARSLHPLQSGYNDDNYSEEGSSTINVSATVEAQHQAVWNIANAFESLHGEMEKVRYRYRHYEKDVNVLDKADHEERERQHKLDEQVQVLFLNAANSAGTGTATAASISGSLGAPAPAATGGFGAAAAPKFGLGAAPAPSTGFSFGGAGTGATAAAPTTATTPAFGAPAPATATTSAFGAPAPAFGAPAPAFGAPAVGAFGAPAAAPAATGGFGGFSSSSTPRSKKGGRGSNRRR